MRLGSLCTGYGGLDLAVEMTFGPIGHAWHAEIDPDASRVLAHHWPDVPNLGDLRSVDWSSVEPVDILTAGFPCQPVSSAGQRKGVDDDRWLWDDIADAVGRMDPRPRLLVLENVPGLLTANRGHAMARVVQRLAALGYVGRYRTVRASDVGAPHRRERVFIVARLADTDGYRRQGCRDAADARAWQPDVVGGGAEAGMTLLPTPTANDAKSSIKYPGGGPTLNGAMTLLPTPRAQNGEPRNQNVWRRSQGEPLNLENALALLPTPNAAQGRGTGTPSRETAERRMYAEGRRFLDDAVALLPTPAAIPYGNNQLPSPGAAVRPSLNSLAHADRWGDYGPAIAGWEQVIGRPAPDPTEPGSKGQPRLSPRFVEWLMGLPAGWVTDHLPRNAALRVLGNGVVPQQAAYALAHLAAEVPA